MVASNFGAVFAPRHAVVASELARVCRPDGTIVLTTWTRDRFNERLAEVGQPYLPQPPIPEPSVLWADPEHARACFADTGVELAFERDVARPWFQSVHAVVEVMGSAFGPVVLARQRLVEQGRWDELQAAVTREFERWAKPAAGGIEIDMDYVVIIGRKPARRSVTGGAR